MTLKEYVKIAVGLREHPKILQAGDDAGWLYVCAIMWSKEHDTDGFIPRYALARLNGQRNKMRLCSRLVAVALFEVRDDGWFIHDYLDVQESSERRKRAGKIGAEARWNKDKAMRSASESHANGTANGTAVAMRNRNGEEEEEEEEEEEKNTPQPPQAGEHGTSSLEAVRAERARQGSQRHRDTVALAAVEMENAKARVTPASPENRQAWETILTELRRVLPASTFHAWVEPLRLVGVDDGVLLVAGPVNQRHAIERVSNALGTPTRIATAHEENAA
jgi:hypothetical protein